VGKLKASLEAQVLGKRLGEGYPAKIIAYLDARWGGGSRWWSAISGGGRKMRCARSGGQCL